MAADVQALAATVREGIVDGCSYACGCDRPGNDACCIHADRFAALDGLVGELTRKEEALEAIREFDERWYPMLASKCIAEQHEHGHDRSAEAWAELCRDLRAIDGLASRAVSSSPLVGAEPEAGDSR